MNRSLHVLLAGVLILSMLVGGCAPVERDNSEVLQEEVMPTLIEKTKEVAGYAAFILLLARVTNEMDQKADEAQGLHEAEIISGPKVTDDQNAVIQIFRTPSSTINLPDVEDLPRLYGPRNVADLLELGFTIEQIRAMDAEATSK